MARMRRLASILVLASVALLGSGAMSYLHGLSHAVQDRQAAAHPGDPTPVHDEAKCLFHAILRAPGLAAGPVPLRVFLGLFVAFLTFPAPRPISVRVPLRIDCRGPPPRSSLLPA